MKDVEQLLRNYYQAETRDLHAPRDLWNRISKGLGEESKSLLKKWSFGKGPWFTRLHVWREVLEQGATLGMLVLFAFLAITTFFFIRSQSRLMEPGVTPAVAPTLTPQPTPTPTLTPQPAPTPTPSSARIESFEVVRLERWLNRDRTGMTTVESHHWYQGPIRYRKEWRQVDPPQPDSELLFVMDGEAAWSYNPAENRVTIQEAGSDLADIQPPPYYGAKERLEMINAGNLYTATLVGSETIAGREAYLLELRPQFSMAVSSSDPDLIVGVEKWWLDVETDFELKYEQYTTEGLLVTAREVTYIAYNLDLPDELFTFKFQIPEGATIIDHRPLSVPVASPEAQTFWAQIAKEMDFQLFAPGYIPETLPEPEVLVEGYADTPKTVELIYGSPLEDASFLSIDERGITEDLRADIPQDAIVVEIGEIEGRLTAGDERNVPTRLYLVREGTYILLQSFGLPEEELIAIAISLEPVPRMSSLPTPTPTVNGATVVGRVVLGYGSHQPVANLPLWVGRESQGEPATRTNANGEFTLTNLPTGLVDVVNSHLAFQVPVSSPGAKIDLGVLKYPLIHPPTFYWQTPVPLPNLSVLLTEGQPIEFSICQTDTTWSRPPEQVQRDTVWSKRLFSDQGEQFLKWWFRQPAVIYDTVDVFVQSFPEGPNLDAMASDWRYLLGMWTGEDLSRSQCAYDAYALDGLLARKQIEVWLLGYQAHRVQRLGEHFAVQVTPARGFQIIRFAGSEGPVSVHIVKDDAELLQLPKFCRSAANPDCLR